MFIFISGSFAYNGSKEDLNLVYRPDRDYNDVFLRGLSLLGLSEGELVHLAYCNGILITKTVYIDPPDAQVHQWFVLDSLFRKVRNNFKI